MFCKLIVCANHWVKESDWKDLALVKLCVGALGPPSLCSPGCR